MTPRPIHKWKTFWLGLLALAFLTWAWTSSLSRGSYASIRTGPLTWHGITSAEGQLTYAAAIYKSTSYLDSSRTATGTYVGRPVPIWFPAAIEIRHTTNPIADQYHSGIAYWLIILLFLISWYSFLLWRWRKAKRIRSSQSPPAPAPPC